MEQMVIALDVDGTLFDGVSVAPAAIDAIRQAHADGHTIIIVTGRRWESLQSVVPSVVELCDRIVCEEGGVMVNVGSGELTLLAEPLEQALLAELVVAEIPDLDVGHVVVGAPFAWLAEVQAARDAAGSERHLVINKGSVALAPGGCDKGTGLYAAMVDLDVVGRRIIAIGDAANDLPMFAIASVAVGVANADDTVRAAGIQLTTGAAGLGVAEALRTHVPRSD